MEPLVSLLRLEQSAVHIALRTVEVKQLQVDVRGFDRVVIGPGASLWLGVKIQSRREAEALQ